MMDYVSAEEDSSFGSLSRGSYGYHLDTAADHDNINGYGTLVTNNSTKTINNHQTRNN